MMRIYRTVNIYINPQKSVVMFDLSIPVYNLSLIIHRPAWAHFWVVNNNNNNNNNNNKNNKISTSQLADYICVAKIP